MKKHVILAGGFACITGLGMLAYLLYPAPGVTPAFSCHGGVTLLGQDPSQPVFHGTFTFRADNGCRAFLVLNGTVSAGGKSTPLTGCGPLTTLVLRAGRTRSGRDSCSAMSRIPGPPGKPAGRCRLPGRTDGTVTMVDVDPLQAPAGFLITAGTDTRLLCTEN